MKKIRLLCILLLFALALSACGSSPSGSAAGSSSAFDGSLAESYNMSSSHEEPQAAPEEYGRGFDQMTSTGVSGGGSFYENTKTILTADLSLQTTDFGLATQALDELVSANQGYYESSEFNAGYGGGNRWGYFTIRVPRANYSAFLDAVGDVGHLVSRSTGVQDVGEAYYDAELHLSTLTAKHERLLALMERAELMEDIITLESALSQVEFELQQYSSTLTRYDGLIDFSTIHLNLREVVRLSDDTGEADPLSARVGSAFTKGWNSFCDGAVSLLLWLAYNFAAVLLLLAAAVVIAALLLRRRRSRSAPAPADTPRREDHQDQTGHRDGP